MKKSFITLLALSLVALMAGGAWAYNYVFPNDTYVRAFQPQSSGPDQVVTWNGFQWHDTIEGSAQSFKSYGADLSYNSVTNQYQLTLYTDFDGSYLNYTYSDLFFDAPNGARWDYAIRVSAVNLNGTATTVDIYDLGSYPGAYQTSQDFVSSTSHIFGGEYDHTFSGVRPTDGVSGEVVPVLVNVNNLGNQDIGDATVQAFLTGGPYKDALYKIVVSWNKSDLDFWAQKEFLWGTGTCANDTIGGKVPLPGAPVLLGAGLFRLVAFGRRRRNLV